MYVFNAAGLTKPHAIEHLTTELLGYQIDLGQISESKMKSKHSDGALAIDGYNIFRRDREGRGGGGVMIYASPKLGTEEWTYSRDEKQFEILWIKVDERYSNPMLISAIYHPPKPKYIVSDLLSYLGRSKK